MKFDCIDLFSWMNATKSAVLNGFWQKNGLGINKVNENILK